MKRRILVLAAKTQQSVLDHECDIVNDCDTICEAKLKAQRHIESSEPICYAQVVVNDECVADYFRKGYNGL